MSLENPFENPQSPIQETEEKAEHKPNSESSESAQKSQENRQAQHEQEVAQRKAEDEAKLQELRKSMGIAETPNLEKTPFQEQMDYEEHKEEYREQGRAEFGAAQKAQESVIKNIVSYLKGEGPFRRADITEEERRLLERMSAEVRKNMRENQGASVNLDFSKNPDAYKVWSGLVNRMVKERLGQV